MIDKINNILIMMVMLSVAIGTIIMGTYVMYMGFFVYTMPLTMVDVVLTLMMGAVFITPGVIILHTIHHDMR